MKFKLLYTENINDSTALRYLLVVCCLLNEKGNDIYRYRFRNDKLQKCNQKLHFCSKIYCGIRIYML